MRGKVVQYGLGVKYVRIREFVAGVIRTGFLEGRLAVA